MEPPPSDSASSLQEVYDDAMFDFSQGRYESSVTKLKSILASNPTHFDAQLALGMAFYRLGDYPKAIAEGHKAESLRPKEQLVHTNLSLFYMKFGDKKAAEHHGLQARIASWREPAATSATQAADPELKMAVPKPPPSPPIVVPDRPWKKK